MDFEKRTPLFDATIGIFVGLLLVLAYIVFFKEQEKTPLEIINIEFRSPNQVYYERHVERTFNGIWHVEILGEGGKICEGSGTDLYEKDEPQSKIMSVEEFTGDKDCTLERNQNYVFLGCWSEIGQNSSCHKQYWKEFILE